MPRGKYHFEKPPPQGCHREREKSRYGYNTLHQRDRASPTIENRLLAKGQDYTYRCPIYIVTESIDMHICRGITFYHSADLNF